MKRTIKPHKGGRTAQPPRSRITPETRQKLDEILAIQNKSFADWLTELVEREQIK